MLALLETTHQRTEEYPNNLQISAEVLSQTIISSEPLSVFTTYYYHHAQCLVETARGGCEPSGGQQGTSVLAEEIQSYLIICVVIILVTI